MRLLNLLQGSPEWLEYRNSRVTSTDAAILMGLNPYETPYERWQLKLGLIPSPYVTAAMQRGTDLEQKARDAYTAHTGIPMMACCVESENYPFMMASLDGIDPEGWVIQEIKCPGPEAHASAVMGVVPEMYWAQCQHHLACTNLNLLHYWSFDGENGILIVIPRNNEFIDRLIQAAHHFHECVIHRKPPPLTERDCEARSDEDWQAGVLRWQVTKNRLDEAEKAESEARENLKWLSGGKNCEGSGIRLRKVISPGKIEYAKIPELALVDLDCYRKPPIIKWVINKRDVKNGSE